MNDVKKLIFYFKKYTEQIFLDNFVYFLGEYILNIQYYNRNLCLGLEENKFTVPFCFSKRVNFPQIVFSTISSIFKKREKI